MQPLQRRQASVLLLIGTFCYLAYSTLSYGTALGWDESVYLAMGRYVSSFGSSGLFESIRPPLLSLSLSLFSSRYLMILFGIFGVIGTYQLGRTLEGERAGIMSAVLLSITPLYITYSTRYMTSIPASAFVVWSLYFAATSRFALAGVLSALALFTRYPAGLIFIAVLTCYHKRDEVITYLTGASLVIIPLLIYMYFTGTLSSLLLSLTHAGNTYLNTYDPLFYLRLLQPLYLIGVVGLGYLFFTKKTRSAGILGLLFILFFSAIANQQDRFALLYLPLLAIGSAVLMSKHEITTGLFVFGIFCMLPAYPIMHDTLYPEAQGELFTKIDQYNGTILTSMPFPAAYGNALYIPMYEDPSEAFLTYTSHSEADYVLYSPQYHPCTDCYGYLELEENVFANEQLWNMSVGGYDYFFFKYKSQ